VNRTPLADDPRRKGKRCNATVASGHILAEPAPGSGKTKMMSTNWRELFQGIYRRRTLTIWTMWFCSYLVANGMITWMPTLYQQTFNLPLQTSLFYGLLTFVAGVIAAVICAMLIDKVGRKKWYAAAFFLAAIPLVALALCGASTPLQVLALVALAYAIVQTITFSLYLYSAEIYPTRLRAVGTGFGSAWLRLGSSAGPILVGGIMASLGINVVFGAFACVLLVGGIVTALCGIETKGRELEDYRRNSMGEGNIYQRHGRLSQPCRAGRRPMHSRTTPNTEHSVLNTKLRLRLLHFITFVNLGHSQL
jgi:putative MFS transporter